MNYAISILEQLAAAPAFWICLIYATTDAMRDKMNLAAYKYPNSGFSLNWWRFRFTVDLWHCIKWVHLYSAGAFVWLHVPTLVGKAITVALAWALWQAIPRPHHWK